MFLFGFSRVRAVTLRLYPSRVNQSALCLERASGAKRPGVLAGGRAENGVLCSTLAWSAMLAVRVNSKRLWQDARLVPP